MRPGLTALLLAATTVAIGHSAAAQKRAPAVGHARRVFVSVTDTGGAPILDLRASDFEITEGSRKREVLNTGLATNPMRIAVFVDTSDGTSAALNALRAGLLAFVDAVPPDAELLMITTGRQVRVRVQPTTDRRKLKDFASGVFGDGGATPLRDALLEVDDRFFRKADDRWPILVIIVGDGAESSAPANEQKFNQWLNGLPARGVLAFGFGLKFRGGGVPDVVAEHVARAAGGTYDFMNTSNGLPDKMKTLGERLAVRAKEMGRWYEVEFETGSDGTAPVEVGVARSGVAVRVMYRRQ
jgi:Mg-chelatase subunit ChlD